MVCVTPEDRVCESVEARVQCIVHRIDAALQNEKYEGTFPASTPVNDLIKAVADKFQEDPTFVHLMYQCPTGDTFEYSDDTQGTLGSIGLNTDYGARNSMILEVRGSRSRSGTAPVKRVLRPRTAADRRLARKEEAFNDSSPSTSSNPPPPPMALDYSVSAEEAPKRYARTSDETAERSLSPGYVGLVNQAMTCYLNSLLQALFMTPEFRNALYKWKFDPSLGASAQKCIPYQLQKLFLNLQTSSKTAVETTELTKSFGWESGEVWQQHDIQELCRVMFDALEHEFKNTEQADLINRLYQGKMIDYVKCLECGTEKSKEDVFLDIPLPVRPFGSAVAYKDIDEALKAFVLPETLNENNQYFCEACNKKCDAHKGLKFSKFPYLLTLHLKRFDFDYNIMHRIKLNDKVTFPEVLDLNGFIQNCETPGEENLEVTIKCDDSSTTDSALDEDTNHTVNEASVFETDQEDDEGIDLSNNSNNSQENEKNINQSLSRGPFVYELYSIMIHSGSASGGHYYAYIKDFSRGEWYCFNDQSVTPITREDIIKTYGGGPHRMYYNGAHSSSTNAYMLMYRQIDKAQNCLAMTVDDFPPHIQKILDEIVESEEREKALKAKEEEMVKLKVYCNHPGASQKSIKIFIHNEDTFADALNLAWKQLKLDSVIPEDQCRLVAYNTAREYFELSFEGKEKSSVKDILNLTEQINRGINVRAEFFLETRDKDKKFFPYNLGDASMIVYLVDVENCDVTSATFLRTSPCQTVEQLKEFLQEAIPLETKDIHIALARNKNVTYVSEKDRHGASRPLNKAGFFSENRVFITPATQEDGDMCANFEKSKFFRCVFELKNVILLQLSLPENLEDQCDSLLIPLLDDKNDPSKEDTTSDVGECNPRLNGIEEELAYSGASGTSDQSASEDSSLTDSERTIIGDTEVGTNDGRVSSGSDSEQLFSPVQATPNLPQSEEESTTFFWNSDINSSSLPKSTPQNLYFRAEIITEVAGAPTPTGEQKMLKIAVDKNMDIETVKTKLERYVGVAGKYLKLLQSPDSRSEVMSFLQNKDNDKIAIGLNRNLEPDEFKAKLYYFNPNNIKNQSQTNPVELIICTAKTVGDTKKDIAKELAKKGWKVPVDRIRLRTKEWKSPGKILLDHVVWEEQVQQNTIELFFQNLDGPEKVTANTFLVMFVRRWQPSTLALGTLSEVVIDHQNEFLKRLSEMSEIPVENIEFVKGSSLFLSDINVLNVHDLDWTSDEEILVEWKKSSYGVALIVFYRDSREELKSLTKEEEEEMAQNEPSNQTSTSSPYISNYSPRKERALKIYWDNKSSNRIMDLD